MSRRRVAPLSRIALKTSVKPYAPVAHYYGGQTWSCGNNKGRFVADAAAVTCKRCLSLLGNRATEVPGPRKKVHRG